MTKLKFQLQSSVGLSLNGFDGFAGLVAERTRIIYPEQSPEIEFMLNNANAYTVQSHIWVDQGLGDADKSQAPFIVLNPTFELAPNQSQKICIAMTHHHALAQDCESLFWLNLHETQTETIEHLEQDTHNMSMNTQLKLFYRPQHLAAFNAEHASQQLQFTLQKDDEKLMMRIFNPAMHYVSMSQLCVDNGQQRTHADVADLMIAPKSTQHYTFSLKYENIKDISAHFHLIDDEGHHHAFQHHL